MVLLVIDCMGFRLIGELVIVDIENMCLEVIYLGVI